jgi:hypothetical protein
MEYRATTPSDNGFDNEHEELEAMRDYIQTMMIRSSPNDLLDSLLIVVNICELRKDLSLDKKLSAWYATTGKVFRDALDRVAIKRAEFRPQEKFENPVLYFPAQDQFH